MRMRVFRIKLNGAVQHLERLAIGFTSRPVMQDLASQDVLIRGHIVGSFTLDPMMPGRFNATKQRRDNSRRNLVLNCENVLKLPVIAYSPALGLFLVLH